MKKILFVCGAGIVGGKERQILEYMLELRQRGNEVYCVISNWASTDFERLLTDNHIPFSKIRIGFISMTLNWSAITMTLHQAIYLPTLFLTYSRLIRQLKPCVVVHSNFHHVLLLLPLLRSPRQVFHVHDVFQVSPKFRRLFRMFNKRIDKFVGVSEFVCQNVRDLGVPPEKIELVYNGVKMPRHVERKENQTPVIAIVGQIGPWKGHDVLIGAIDLLRDLDWGLHIIGSGDPEYINALKKKIETLKLNDRVVFVGHRSGLENIYQNVDIGCVPSQINESFGLAAAEPAFFGIPVVVSNKGALPEIVVNGETGLIVPMDDRGALSRALRELLIDVVKRKKMGAQARERIMDKFSIDNSSVKLEAILNSLCNP